MMIFGLNSEKSIRVLRSAGNGLISTECDSQVLIFILGRLQSQRTARQKLTGLS